MKRLFKYIFNHVRMVLQCFGALKDQIIILI